MMFTSSFEEELEALKKELAEVKAERDRLRELSEPIWDERNTDWD